MAQELRIVVTDRDGAFTFVPCLRKIRGRNCRLLLLSISINGSNRVWSSLRTRRT
jgi:hypothetical protein